jgi:hypothetical protein
MDYPQNELVDDEIERLDNHSQIEGNRHILLRRRCDLGHDHNIEIGNL